MTRSVVLPILVPLLCSVFAEVVYIQDCTDTRCSNFRNFEYNETVDLLSCECLPGWKGQCCQVETECANGRWNPAESTCDCYDRHYEGRRCEVVSCDNDGVFVAEERWSSHNATGCSCYPGTSGDFCQFGSPTQVAGRSMVRVRITSQSRTRLFSNWNRPVNSPHYRHHTYHTYGYGHGFNPHWLWLVLLMLFISIIFAAIFYNSRNGCCHRCNKTETIVTKTVADLNATEDETVDLLTIPSSKPSATVYTAKFHQTASGDIDTTTKVEVFRDL